MNLKAVFAVLAIGLAGLSPAVAQEETAQASAQQVPIYADQLAQGWDNWSWAQVTLGVSATDGERPIQVRAGAWQALYLRRAPFSTTGLTKLAFYINGGQGGQTVSVVAINPAGEVIADRAFLFTPPANDWALVEVPLADISAANTEVSGFWIQNGTPNDAAPFFVNYIVLE